MFGRPPGPPLFPYTTLFRSEIALDFTIEVPANADPGSHWGGVVIRTAPVATGSGAAVQARLGTIVLLNVLGDVKEKDRKSTRLNSSHRCISYAVFCLKKKKT